MKQILWTFLAFATALTTAGTVAYADAFHLNSADSPFIVGGDLVPAGSPIATTTVLITDGNFICTGSLIDTDMVVTAAHCTAAKVADLKIVFTTDLNQLTQSEVRPITGLVANPGWQGEQSTGPDQHDIALMRVDGNLPDGYQPANLLSADDSASISKGDVAILAGYGITDAKTQAGAGVLRAVQVNVLKKLGQTEIVLDQRDGQGACHGDSGGPAFTQDGQLWGVTNRGYPNSASDDCLHESVYTKIQAYADWIVQTEAQLRGSNQ